MNCCHPQHVTFIQHLLMVKRTANHDVCHCSLPYARLLRRGKSNGTPIRTRTRSRRVRLEVPRVNGQWLKVSSDSDHWWLWYLIGSMTECYFDLGLDGHFMLFDVIVFHCWLWESFFLVNYWAFWGSMVSWFIMVPQFILGGHTNYLNLVLVSASRVGLSDATVTYWSWEVRFVDPPAFRLFVSC